ncbi:MAG: hypothetical protein D6696_06190 [Acidobacteria bacterium]|nr:MAG: hypothetical protein D6696_06190 [Acidobacteriota bacterium]
MAGESPVSREEIAAVLAALRALPPEAPASSWWRRFDRRRWPALFRLLDLAAGLPRLRDQPALADLEPGLWPELEAVTADLLRLQRLADEPVVPAAAGDVPSFAPGRLAAARARLEEHHCVNLDGLLDRRRQAALEEAVAALAVELDGTWGELDRQRGAAVYELIEGVLGGGVFRRLTGFELGRDPYTLTLSLQRLAATGIAWHRDLYWPREWVGRDVFALFYALDDDRPEKGGAFVYYLPWHNRIYAFYRRRHQATILWNSADPAGRILHAVSSYHGDDTSRRLLIVQCLRGGGRG